MDKETLWETVLKDLKTQVSQAVYQTFFKQTTLEKIEGDEVVIGCKKPLLIMMLEKRYQNLIKETLDSYTKTENRLIFTASGNGHKTDTGPLFLERTPTPKNFISSGVKLNREYTFDNFAVSSSNQMAYAAATAVAKTPGTTYNPMFLYGGVGVGKTHLMQAIGHYLLLQKPSTKIIYCTGEEFTNEIIEAISNKTTALFKKKFRHVDILLIDDVQFIAGKYSIQEEFFHTFNAIQQNKGQIVMTSDRPPEEINKLEERLKSRFEGGLAIDIGEPDFELKTAILLIKAKKHNIEIPIDIAKLLSANVENIRKLEGLLIRVSTESRIKGIPIDYELVRNILGKAAKDAPVKKNISPEKAIDAVASYYNLKLSDLKGDRRDKYLVVPRQILYYILRVELGIPLMDIGETLGGRDHTTILHGVRKVSRLLSTDDKMREDIMGIKGKVFG